MDQSIILKGVRQNNLKNIDVRFPLGKMTVVTGLSGSGKSSLAFETLFVEGQRRYIDSLSTYVRQFLEKLPRPLVQSVENIPPAIALEQRNSVVSSRTTVGTQTEVSDYVRLLYSRIGKTICPKCSVPAVKLTREEIALRGLRSLHGRTSILASPVEISKKTAESYLQLLLERGFQRLLLWSASQESVPTLVRIEECLERKRFSFPNEGVWCVLDRIKIPVIAASEEVPSEIFNRTLEAVESAFQVGPKVLFITPEAEAFEIYHQDFGCPQCKAVFQEPQPQAFSFSSPLGACSNCKGFGFTLELDERLVVPDPARILKRGAIDPFSKPSAADEQRYFFRGLEKRGVSLGTAYRDLKPEDKIWVWDQLRAFFQNLEQWKYKVHVRVFIRRYQKSTLCPECRGARLNASVLMVKIGGLQIAEFHELSIRKSLDFVNELNLDQSEKKTATEVLDQLKRRLHYLDAVGLGYLTLSRLSKTVSGGEYQRMNLATQLGNGLCGTLYVLDEPSIGLHWCDTERLIRVLKQLRDQGNTVVIVEHDPKIIEAGDWVIELGPAQGERGGNKVAETTPAKLLSDTTSVTGKFLASRKEQHRNRAAQPPGLRKLFVKGCRENNLKNIDVTIPLERLVAICGPSGSGKSTLVHQILYAGLNELLHRVRGDIGKHERIEGFENISGVSILDQTPIGRSSRSTPATYIKAWDVIRGILSSQPISIRRGFTPNYFSLNVDGGRCPMCSGEGVLTLDMHFLSEVQVPCEECDGKRFKKSVLEIDFRGKTLEQIFHLTIDEAYELFMDFAQLRRKFGVLRDVGLGYLRVGQSVATLSGGESQRLKIAHALDSQERGQHLFIFDEPTTGLHMADVQKLMEVIHELVANRNSVVLIEHNLDVISQADWIVDLGPEGGDAGGFLMAEGSPAKVAGQENSLTGRALREEGFFVVT